MVNSNFQFRRRFALFLLPGLYQAALPFLTLPLTTRVLGPADFALFSVAGAIAALLTTVAQLGSVFILAQRFATSDDDTRRKLVSTIYFQCLVLSTAIAALVLLLWPVVQGEWTVGTGITETMIALVMIGAVGTSLYTLVGTLATFGHAPGYYSVITMIKVTVSVGSTLVALFVFDCGVLSLFIGMFAAGVFDLIGSTLFMMPFLRWRYDGQVARDCLCLGGWNSLAQLTIQGRQFLERSVLSSTAGLHDLGLFVHAQQYQNFTMLGTRPMQQAMVPIMLEEAGQPEPAFARTARITGVLFLVVITIALTFAFFGDVFIHLLTNGKFDAAAPYGALLIAVLLLQSAGRAQFARLLSQGRGRYLSACNIAAVAVAAVLLILLAPRMGVAAAVAAIYVQYGLFRLGIELDAFKSGRLPFQDLPGIAGVALVGVAVVIVQVGEPGFLARVLWLIGGLALTAAVNRTAIGDLVGQAQISGRALAMLAMGRHAGGRQQSSRGKAP